MKNQSLTTKTLGAVLIAVLAVAVGIYTYQHLSAPLTYTGTEYREDSAPATAATFTLERATPTVIRIPRVSIEASFEESLGLNPDRTIAVPDGYDTVGWYQYSPTPGELGPAVVLGHVDSQDGPAVFFSLGQLRAGDDIYIERADGSTAHFVVTHLEREAQDAFPTQAVYGDIDHAGLRLITCSGEFIRGEQRYTHNLIVFARLVEPAVEPPSENDIPTEVL